MYPNDDNALAYHAHANAMQGDVAIAIDTYKKVLMRDPERADAKAYLENKGK